MNKKLFTLVFVVLIGIASYFKFSADDVKAQEIKNKITIAMKADPKTLDPQKSIDTISNKSITLIYDTLLDLDENLNLKPCLAERWERLDEYNTVFYLKKGVKFHNGEELKAEDVKFTLERAAVSPQTLYLFNPIEKVTVLDDYTVKITTKTPFGALLNNLATVQSGIVSKKAVLEYGDDYTNHPVGTGQYKLKEWIPGSKITFEKFDDSFLGKPNFNEVTYLTIPEVSNRMISLETGEVDIAFDIGIMDKIAIENNKNLELIEVESPALLYLGFDQTNPKYQNKKLREAIAYAIDNQTFVDVVFKGSAVAGDSPLPKASPAYNSEVKRYDQNIEKAKQLLVEAGYPNGLDIELWCMDDGPRVDMCVIIQDQLKKIGINVEIKVFEFGSYVSKTALPNKELYFLSWNSSGDGDVALYPLFHSSQHGSSGNRSFYTNKKVDELLDKARTSVDETERTILYKEVQDILQEDLAIYSLVYPKINLAKNKNLKGLIFKKNGDIDITNLYQEVR
ncbi:ABC transporter substrate-binding protein [uncultured Fusobacterium sp.]|uniref:ABC transporter substrate-binding protein n=1 Tax=uncultured Fusobacterium sp. TaxID=159267 RepID=UPI0025FA7F17|nr:ABC transporter substrate-binding protein [uncultured Fusobacterium sp.]